MLRFTAPAVAVLALLTTVAVPVLAHHGGHYVMTGAGNVATATSPAGWTCTQPALSGAVWEGRCVAVGHTWCAEPEVTAQASGVGVAFARVRGETDCVTGAGTLGASCVAAIPAGDTFAACNNLVGGYLSDPQIEVVCRAFVTGVLVTNWRVECELITG